jgi:cytochrome P450
MQSMAIGAIDRVARVLPPGRKRARRVKAQRLPAGPVMHPSAQLAFWMLRPIAFLEYARARYGTTFTMQLPGLNPIVSFADEAANKEVFTGPAEELYAGRANESLRPIVGGGSLLLLDGERHLRERRLLLPPFHGARLHAYGEIIRDITRREMARWSLDAPAAIQPGTQHITLDVILRTVFGLAEGADLIALRAAILHLLDGASPLNMIPALQVDLGKRSPWGRFLERRAEVDTLLYRVIASRRASGTEGHQDILSLMLDARYEDGAQMSDRDLRDELMTLLAAGHETSATALAWAFTCLAKNPQVQARAHEEVDRVLGGGVLGGGAADDAVTKAELPYLDAIIKETMRIHPVVYAVGRVLQKPRTIGGVDVPAGHAAILSIYLTHHDPKLWPEPARFDPERFLGAPTGPGNRVTPYTYFPFGGGVRRCIGMAFAMYEMRIVLAEALRRFRVEPAGEVHAVRRTVTMAPSGGGVVTLRDRSRRS